MLKMLLSGLLVFLGLSDFAQTTKIEIPMKKGKVYYEKSYTVSSDLQQKDLFKKVEEWFKLEFQNTQKIKVSADKQTGEITGVVIFKIVTSSSGNYYIMRSAISIKVYNGGYTYTADKFYEKPVETGISNEYSKIEYRWWDYRQGKPWSTEDETLFKGIAADETALMTSLENQMK